MKQQNNQPNRWRALEQWAEYAKMRLSSPKWLAIVAIWLVVNIWGIYFFLPQYDTFVNNSFMVLTWLITMFCLFLYINHGYRRHKRQ